MAHISQQYPKTGISWSKLFPKMGNIPDQFPIGNFEKFPVRHDGMHMSAEDNRSTALNKHRWRFLQRRTYEWNPIGSAVSSENLFNKERRFGRDCLSRVPQWGFQVRLGQGPRGGLHRKSSPFGLLLSHNFRWFRAPSLKCMKKQCTMYHAYNTSGPGHYEGTQTKGELLPFSPMFVRKSPGGVFLLSMQITVVACQKGPPLFGPPGPKKISNNIFL